MRVTPTASFHMSFPEIAQYSAQKKYPEVRAILGEMGNIEQPVVYWFTAKTHEACSRLILQMQTFRGEMERWRD